MGKEVLQELPTAYSSAISKNNFPVIFQRDLRVIPIPFKIIENGFSKTNFETTCIR